MHKMCTTNHVRAGNMILLLCCTDKTCRKEINVPQKTSDFFDHQVALLRSEGKSQEVIARKLSSVYGESIHRSRVSRALTRIEKQQLLRVVYAPRTPGLYQKVFSSIYPNARITKLESKFNAEATRLADKLAVVPRLKIVCEGLKPKEHKVEDFDRSLWEFGNLAATGLTDLLRGLQGSADAPIKLGVCWGRTLFSLSLIHI